MRTIPRFYPLGFDKQKLSDLMQERHLAGILLTSPENVFYATGYTCLPSSGNPILFELQNRLPFFSYVDAQGHVVLLCWGFSAEGVAFGADEVLGFNDFAGAMQVLSDLLRREHPANEPLGIERFCPYSVVQLVSDALPGSGSPRFIDDVLIELRLTKSGEEIMQLRTSTGIIEQTVSELYDLLHVGMSRLDLIQEAKRRMIEHGATGISHVTFSFGKENPEVAIDEQLHEGQLVTLDLGAFYNGYASDNRRYAYTGAVPSTLRERYETMVHIVDEVGSLLVPWTPYAAVYRHALKLYQDAGVENLKRFTHVGHHIGLRTEEQWIDTREDALIKPGSVINLELYTVAPTGVQIGDEETYVISEDGPTRITVLPRVIRSV